MNLLHFERFASSFLGIGTVVPVLAADGTIQKLRSVYLDSAATCKASRIVRQVETEYLERACANAHTSASFEGRSTTLALNEARSLVGMLVGSNENDCVMFVGSGATAAANLLAEALAPTAERPLVVVSAQEHHSNMLPWMRAAGVDNVRTIPATADGSLDVEAFARILAAEGSRVRVVAVTAVSNVTGVVNDLPTIANMTHAAGALIVVDAAQAAAHVPISMHSDGYPTPYDVDYLIMSGHKLYAPGSPGVVVGRNDLLCGRGWSGWQIGGGTVDRVLPDRVEFHHDAVGRHEAGTQDIPGAVSLGAAAACLLTVGMDAVRAHELPLLARMVSGLRSVPDVVTYGPDDLRRRAGLVAFNVGAIPHGLVAAILSDSFAIAVRNDCFCAQPYVRNQLEQACIARDYCEALTTGKVGMVRASLGIYSTADDIDRLVAAVRWIAVHGEELSARYELKGRGVYVLKEPFRRPFSIVESTTALFFFG